MKNNNLIPPIYEVQYLKEENIKLPSVEEISKNGLSDKFKQQLLNPNSKFDGDLVVFPLADENRKAAKSIGLVAGIGAGLLTLVCPPAGAAVITAYAATAVGAEVVKELSDDENTKEGAEAFSMAFTTAATSGTIIKEL